jgi:hypothetical protein
VRVDSSGSGWAPVEGSCEHGNKTFGSIESGEFLDQPSNYQLL